MTYIVSGHSATVSWQLFSGKCRRKLEASLDEPFELALSIEVFGANDMTAVDTST